MNESRSYGPTIGHLDVRRAVAEYSSHQGPVTAEDVILCSGCSHAIEMVISVIAEPGRNIIVPRPGYMIHTTIGGGMGIAIKYYDLLVTILIIDKNFIQITLIYSFYNFIS